MSIVTLTFGVSPEKIKTACEDTNLSDEVVAKLSQLNQVVVDLHVNEEGQVTGGFVPDLRKKKDVENKPKPVITFESVISAYRKTRDEEIPALNDKVSLLKEVQQKREDWLAAQLTKIGGDSFKVNGVGRAEFFTVESVTVSDAPTFRSWILEDPEERLCFVDTRASKDQVITRVTDKGAAPPGVSYKTFKKVRVVKDRK